MPVKTVVVTGASSGIGHAVAELLAKQGHTVIGVSRRRPKQGFTWQHIPCDLGDKAAINALLSQLPKSVDAIVHAAGIGVGGAVERIDVNAAEQVTDVNLHAVFRLNKGMIDTLSERERPTIVHIGSLAGIFPIPFQTHYAMSKAALMHYSDALRLELVPLNIRVCTILLGDVKTEFTTARKNYFLNQDARYKERPNRSIEKMARDEAAGMKPENVAKKVASLIKKKRIPSRITLGFTYKLMVFAAKLLPRRLMLYVVYRLYGR